MEQRSIFGTDVVQQACFIMLCSLEHPLKIVEAGMSNVYDCDCWHLYLCCCGGTV